MTVRYGTLLYCYISTGTVLVRLIRVRYSFSYEYEDLYVSECNEQNVILVRVTRIDHTARVLYRMERAVC